jgi:hypothetical protein
MQTFEIFPSLLAVAAEQRTSESRFFRQTCVGQAHIPEQVKNNQ